MVSGSTYYMDVVLHKTNDYVAHEGPSFESWKGYPFSVTTRGWGYGPPYCYSTIGGNDPAWAPHTPPYFYGQSIARIQFSPHEAMDMGECESYVFSLNDILAGAKQQTVFVTEAAVGQTAIEKVAYQALENAAGSFPAADARMQVSSSVSLFGKVSLPSIEYDPQSGEALRATENPQAGMDAWVINSKFECPSLNFYGAQGGAPNTAGALEGEPSLPADPSLPDEASGSLQHRVRGLYNGYGVDPAPGTGIYLELRETYPDPLVQCEDGRGSLLDVCGFQAASSKVGRTADFKVITEAIVAIPFYDVGGERKFFPLGNTPKFSQWLWFTALNGDEGAGKSIRALADRMPRYVIPPHLDFNTNASIEPFAMYIFEFSHKLKKQDLVNIWQGIMPDISIKAEKKVAAFTHKTGANEFFKGMPIPEHTRWMVFKVKRRASQNYYATTADSSDDSRYKFSFKGAEEVVPEYSYNWPYDYFSLIELAKLDVKVGLGDGAFPVASWRTGPLDLTPGGSSLEKAAAAGTLAAAAGTLPGLPGQQAQAQLKTMGAALGAKLGTMDATKWMVGGTAGGFSGGKASIPPGLMAGSALLGDGWAGGTAGGPLADDYSENLKTANEMSPMNNPAGANQMGGGSGGPGGGSGDF